MVSLALTPQSLLNTQQYPINNPGHKHWQSFKSQFEQNGLCVIPDFIPSHVLPHFIDEAATLINVAYHNQLTGNAYLETIDETLPEDHVKKITETTALAVVAYDQFAKDSLVRQIFEWPGLLKLVKTIVGREDIFPYNCPLGAVNIAVMREDDYLRWHFDQSEFVVSIPLQDADEGGIYEYVPNLRSTDSPNYEGVKQVLEGDRTNVKILEAAPGSLVFFQGMNTLHRVTKIHGNTPRLVLLLGYAFEPDIKSSDYLCKIRYGRKAS